MNGFEWAAVIGAGAWLPQIGIFIWRIFFKKPKLRFSPESVAEIGHNWLGPVVNINFAISATRKEALIENISIEAKHSDGDVHIFKWQLLDERGFEGMSSKGERIEMKRSQSAIAIKIGTVGLIERKIYFQDISFKEKQSALFELLNGRDKILSETDRDNYPDNIFKSKEYNDMHVFIKSSFYWKEGRYTINISVNEASLAKPHRESFEFVLTNLNIISLDKNIIVAQMALKETFLIRTGKIQNLSPVFWNWAYPNINRIFKNSIS